MPDHSSFNAGQGTKDATDGSHPRDVTMHVRAPPYAAYAKHKEKKRKRSSRTEGEGVPSEKKKKKHRHDTPEQTAEASPIEGTAISSSGVERHKKKKRKQRSGAQVAETYPRDAVYSPEENHEANSKETNESKQREALENVGTPPATDSQPKKKSKKSKKHRLHKGDAGIASAITVASPSATPQIATVNLDPSPPTDSTLQPTIEQLAEYDNPEDLLRAISRPKATSSSTATSSKGNVAARKGAGAGTQIGSRTRPSKPAFTRLESSLVPVPSGDDDSQTVLLKWLSAGEMKKACEERGIKLKQGQFTQLESMNVAQALAGYRVTNNLSEDSLVELIYAKRGQKTVQREKFWRHITRAVPGRSLLAVYQYVRRKHNPLGNQGLWTEEEDNKLRSAVREYGTHWEEVCLRVGRHASDCRDRYRNHIIHEELRVDGSWTTEEEDLLTRIVLSLTVNQGKDQMFEAPWTIVSERMGYRRSRHQCRIKWQDGLSKRVGQVGAQDVARWGTMEQICLVQELQDIRVNDDSEINWNELTSKASWNYWSAHDVKRRWQTLKKGIDGHENMSFAEIMDVLKAKFADPPANATRRVAKKKRPNTVDEKVYQSRSIISDSSPESD